MLAQMRQQFRLRSWCSDRLIPPGESRTKRTRRTAPAQTGEGPARLLFLRKAEVLAVARNPDRHAPRIVGPPVIGTLRGPHPESAVRIRLWRSRLTLCTPAALHGSSGSRSALRRRSGPDNPGVRKAAVSGRRRSIASERRSCISRSVDRLVEIAVRRQARRHAAIAPVDRLRNAGGIVRCRVDGSGVGGAGENEPGRDSRCRQAAPSTTSVVPVIHRPVPAQQEHDRIRDVLRLAQAEGWTASSVVVVLRRPLLIAARTSRSAREPGRRS